LTSTASPGGAGDSSAVGRLVDAVDAVERDLADERSASGASPRRSGSAGRPGVEDRRGEAGVERGAVLAKLAHRPEHGDPPLDVRFGAEALQVAAIDAGLAL
jgi:hypothetical protein